MLFFLKQHKQYEKLICLELNMVGVIVEHLDKHYRKCIPISINADGDYLEVKLFCVECVFQRSDHL